MRIGLQSTEIHNQPLSSAKSIPAQISTEIRENEKIEAPLEYNQGVLKEKETEDQKGHISSGRLKEAVDSINEFLEIHQKNSKFVLHEGLDKYYVQLVDSETEEVIKEIPPEKLLNAFYEMQKLAGMIVDEKI